MKIIPMLFESTWLYCGVTYISPLTYVDGIPVELAGSFAETPRYEQDIFTLFCFYFNLYEDE